jgi:predicted site-specific integrase-resolvase
MSEEWITMNAAAKQAKITYPMLKRWVDSGKIASKRPARYVRRVYVNLEEVLSILDKERS